MRGLTFQINQSAQFKQILIAEDLHLILAQPSEAPRKAPINLDRRMTYLRETPQSTQTLN
jgi:hypothetical protein